MTEASHLSQRERKEIDAANASGRQPVLFVHGLWLLASSWQPWTEMVAAAGYAPVCADWPGDPITPDAARANPQALAGTSIGTILSHLEALAGALHREPILIGHSMGGLLVQMLAARIGAAATVAISPAPFRGVLPLPVSALRSAFPVLANPLNIRRAVQLTPAQFRYGFANTLTEAESNRLYEEHHVPAPGRPLFQAGLANLNPWTEARVPRRDAQRGPLLIIAAERDNTVPATVSRAAYRIQTRDTSVTELVTLPDAGHSLVIDSGWERVAQTALNFIGAQGMTDGTTLRAMAS
ncbi:Lysophospholipase, alpha-beta hydrolase superfamily [Roseivivax halotolerans]|uniref:Lysophospholipase, alpha-beta hydrolase superfamily n=1 Tax=Roseivivax halotolerans TaxID=93684 RepID=A0A1I6AA40_9RHOB|nr:alpha/beta fold hydrolase [Roseivivax halotolerans]SFQ65483.1 Lysophospholipase, alpha-beta hydrolase superfamily [Roseivivax halotolerans]